MYQLFLMGVLLYVLCLGLNHLVSHGLRLSSHVDHTFFLISLVPSTLYQVVIHLISIR